MISVKVLGQEVTLENGGHLYASSEQMPPVGHANESYDVTDFDGAAPGYCYEEELAALTSPDLRRQIAAVGIERGGFSDAALRL